MSTEIHLNPRLVVERLHRAMNQHDVETLVECIDPLYHTEQPVHPAKAYRGRELIHKEWSEIFKRLNDFHANLLRSAVEQDTVWAEWHWSGTQGNKAKVDMLGVTIFGVRDNRIIWTRMYMESLQKPGAGIEALAR